MFYMNVLYHTLIILYFTLIYSMIHILYGAFLSLTSIKYAGCGGAAEVEVTVYVA